MVASSRTAQEKFWAGEFGDEYVERNAGDKLIAIKTALFSDVLRKTRDIESVIEFGPNIGLNLRALRILLPDARLKGVEINQKAFSLLSQIPGVEAVNNSLFDHVETEKFDLSFVSGVFMHLAPERITEAYAQLYKSSKRYVLIYEYYNPTPVEITYRGHSERLYKRDFAGEMMDIYPDLRLVDYSFIYHRDPIFPDDDATWFLMEKRG